MGREGRKDAKRSGERGVASKGAKREKGRAKTGQFKSACNAADPHSRLISISPYDPI